ncbi:MAG: hypothetical protein AAGB51_12700 [Planctomycetota bacterium]
MSPGLLGKPVCDTCGYDLTGATDTPTCPECGLPLVEVLVRSQGGRRYRSEKTLFGLPLFDIVQEREPGEKVAKAKGIIAIGEHATGWIAIGGFARGFIAMGGVAVGGIAIGGVSIGAVGANGGLAAAGLFAAGGAAIAGYAGFGGVVLSHTGGAPLFFTLW